MRNRRTLHNSLHSSLHGLQKAIMDPRRIIARGHRRDGDVIVLRVALDRVRGLVGEGVRVALALRAAGFAQVAEDVVEAGVAYVNHRVADYGGVSYVI